MKHYINKTIIVLLIILSSSGIYAQEKKIAMLEPIAMTDEISPMVKNMVRGELTKALSREPGFNAFTRLDIDQMIKEFNFQESGMVNDKQRRKLGKMSGADYVCISKISKEENAYYIEAALVNIVSGEIQNPGTAFAEGGIKNVNLACQEVAADMVGKDLNVQYVADDAEEHPGKKKKRFTLSRTTTFPKSVHDNKFKISLLSLKREGTTVELLFTVKNEDKVPQHFLMLGYNGWQFKLYTKDGEMFEAIGRSSDYRIDEEFQPRITLKRKAVFKNIPEDINEFSHLVFKTRSSGGDNVTHSIERIQIEEY